MRFLLLSTCIITLGCKRANDSAPGPFESKEKFIASTPANNQVKAFLNIPATDSVDFIRWDLRFDDTQYQLKCRYGISKPNTWDFMNGGQSIDITGSWTSLGNDRYLKNGSRSIRLVTLNATLLHFVDESEMLMRGNGGWSFTLNRESYPPSNNLVVRHPSHQLSDSTTYEWRTPTGIPGIPGEPVYNKLKWKVVLYADDQTSTPVSYRAVSAPWRDSG